MVVVCGSGLRCSTTQFLIHSGRRLGVGRVRCRLALQCCWCCTDPPALTLLAHPTLRAARSPARLDACSVGAYGANGDVTLSGTNVRTPTLDTLASNGTLFTDFHAAALCCPSRAQWMTGRHAGDVSFNGNPDVSADGWRSNPSHGLPYQLPLPSGRGTSPFAGGLQNVGHLMRSAGWVTAPR